MSDNIAFECHSSFPTINHDPDLRKVKEQLKGSKKNLHAAMHAGQERDSIRFAKPEKQESRVGEDNRGFAEQRERIGEECHVVDISLGEKNYSCLYFEFSH